MPGADFDRSNFLRIRKDSKIKERFLKDEKYPTKSTRESFIQAPAERYRRFPSINSSTNATSIFLWPISLHIDLQARKS